MYDTKRILTRIRQLREKKNYSQKHVASKLKISQNAYSKIELGYSSVTLERFVQIANILEVEATQLLEMFENVEEPAVE